MGIGRLKVAVAVVLALALVGTGAGVLALGKRPADPEAPKKADDKAEQLRRNAATRLELAKSAYAGYLLRYELGVEEEQIVTLWSRRWLQAELGVSDRKADRDAALRAHHERLQKVDQIARARLELGGPPQPKLPGPVRLNEEFDGVWDDYMNRKVSEEQVCHASVRCLVSQQLERKLGKKAPQADPKDLQAHLERMKKVEEVARAREAAGIISGIALDSVLFHRLQAEEWAEQGKTFTDDVLDPGHRLLKD
jgi:hypothetical protein